MGGVGRYKGVVAFVFSATKKVLRHKLHPSQEDSAFLAIGNSIEKEKARAQTVLNTPLLADVREAKTRTYKTKIRKSVVCSKGGLLTSFWHVVCSRQRGLCSGARTPKQAPRPSKPLERIMFVIIGRKAQHHENKKAIQNQQAVPPSSQTALSFCNCYPTETSQQKQLHLGATRNPHQLEKTTRDWMRFMVHTSNIPGNPSWRVWSSLARFCPF